MMWVIYTTHTHISYGTASTLNNFWSISVDINNKTTQKKANTHMYKPDTERGKELKLNIVQIFTTIHILDEYVRRQTNTLRTTSTRKRWAMIYSYIALLSSRFVSILWYLWSFVVSLAWKLLRSNVRAFFGVVWQMWKNGRKLLGCHENLSENYKFSMTGRFL